MTRVNCINPALLLDEWLDAHLREGLRPINNILAGKDSIKDCPSDWKLGEGHEKFLRKHSVFTLNQWNKAKEEYYKREIKHKNYSYDASIEGVPSLYLNDYKPSRVAIRSNIARLCDRWRKRNSGKRGIKYHWNGKLVDDYSSFKEYVSHVKKQSLGELN